MSWCLSFCLFQSDVWPRVNWRKENTENIFFLKQYAFQTREVLLQLMSCESELVRAGRQGWGALSVHRQRPVPPPVCLFIFNHKIFLLFTFFSTLPLSERVHTSVCLFVLFHSNSTWNLIWVRVIFKAEQRRASKTVKPVFKKTHVTNICQYSNHEIDKYWQISVVLHLSIFGS